MTITTQPQADAAERALKIFYISRIEDAADAAGGKAPLSRALGLSDHSIRVALSRDTSIMTLKKICKMIKKVGAGT